MPKEFQDVLHVYDHVSRVALRIGAAIDIAKLLELENGSRFDGKSAIHQTGEFPAHLALKTTLDDADAYNNYLKHTGLPPLRVDTTTGDDIVLVASKLDRAALNAKNVSPWKVTNPDAPVHEQAQAAVGRSLKAFNVFYKALADATSGRLNDWKLSLKAKPAGIGWFETVQDGYATSRLKGPRSGSV